MIHWKDWFIVVLALALVMTNGFWILRARYMSNPSSQYDEYTVDELSWIIEGRMEQLYDDFEDLIQAIVRQKQLLPD